MITTTKYVRKPLFVDAVRVTGANFEEIAAWCQGTIEQEENREKGEIKKFIRVRVHNPKVPRQTQAFIGDWLLYTERGYKVYSSKAFHASFEEADRSEAVTAPPAMHEEDEIRDKSLSSEPELPETLVPEVGA